MKTEDLEKLVASATQLPWKLRPLWDASGLTQNKLEQDCQPGLKFKRDTTTICYFPPDELNKPNAALVEYAANNILRIQRERDKLETALNLHIQLAANLRRERDAAVEALKQMITICEQAEESGETIAPNGKHFRSILNQIEKGTK